MKKLFGSDFIFVMQNARNAYKTAGLSANSYMNMTTQFASKLIQDLGGDTLKAAEMTDKAITDMSDNFNTFGTSMEAVQNAYRGFAKGNYTMLDNLQLGYGGTKTEMERLLADAEKLTGKKYDMSNFADIIDAIHEIQVQQHIAGTTSTEATETISGNWGMVQASWENLLTEMSNPKGFRYLKQYVTEFTDSVKGAIKNVGPTVQQALAGASVVVKELAPVISEELPKLLDENLPTIVGLGLDLGTTIIKGVASILKPKAFTDILKKVGKTLHSKIAGLLGLTSNASATEMAEGLGTKLREGIANLASGAKTTLADLLGIEEDDPSWETVGRSFIGAVHRGMESVKVGLAALLGIDAEDSSWVDIGVTLRDSILGGIKGGNKFLKQLIAGDRYDKLPIDELIGEPSWGSIVGDLWTSLKGEMEGKTLFGENGLIPLGTDILSGIREILNAEIEGLNLALKDKSVQTTLSTMLSTSATYLIDVLGTALTNAPEILKSVTDILWNALNQVEVPEWLQPVKDGLIKLGNMLDLFDENGLKMPGWLGDILKSLDILDEEGKAKEPQWFNELRAALQGLAETIGSLLTDALSALGFFDENGKLQMPEWLGTALGTIVTLLQLIASVIDSPRGIKQFTDKYGLIEGFKMWQEFGNLTEEEFNNLVQALETYDKANKAAEWLNSEEGKQAVETVKQQNAQEAEKTYQFSSDTIEAFIQSVEKYGGTVNERTDTLPNGEKIKGYDVKIGDVSYSFSLDLQGVSLETAIQGLLDKLFLQNNLGGFTITSNAKGLWDVPYDNYFAKLHRDEMVLTASQAREYRNGGNDNSAIVEAIRGLRTDLTQLQIVVGEKTFGRAVVNYGGRRLNGYLGSAEDRQAAGYGWG